MLKLEIYTPFGELVNLDNINSVTIPGVEGDIGILPGHISLITMINSGMISFEKGGKKEYISVHHGFAHISDDHIKVCTKIAEKGVDIDVNRAKKAYEKSINELEDMMKNDDHDKKEINKLQSKISRAKTRASYSD